MRTPSLLAGILFLSFIPAAPRFDYAELFGSDYTWARSWVNTHATAFERTARPLDIPAADLEAIVFPELIRYNGVYDAMEIQSLKFLYVSQGSDYANFSVGYFQMKPSFAENIEKDAQIYLGIRDIAALGLTGLSLQEDNAVHRRERVNRITSVDGQLKYLAAFYKICRSKFRDLSFAGDDERVRFLATCYNAGYYFTADEVKARVNRKFFHTGKIITSANYCYADISAYWLTHRLLL